MYEMKRIVIHGAFTLDSTRTASSYKHPDYGEQKRFCHKTLQGQYCWCTYCIALRPKLGPSRFFGLLNN